jgi:hypothetical protein
MDELDERLGSALQAKTYADLEPLIADLSVDVPWRTRRPGSPRMPVQQPPPAGYSRADLLRLDGGVSSERRDGEWVVPPFLHISSGMGSVKLNFLRATAAAPVIEVNVIAGVGSVVLILPDGWAVNDDRLSKSMGSKMIKAPRTPTPGQPVLLLSLSSDWDHSRRALPRGGSCAGRSPRAGTDSQSATRTAGVTSVVRTSCTVACEVTWCTRRSACGARAAWHLTIIGFSGDAGGMNELLVGYARVSTEQQDLTAQRDALRALGVGNDRIYVDHGLTGTNRDRPGLKLAMAACRAGTRW